MDSIVSQPKKSLILGCSIIFLFSCFWTMLLMLENSDEPAYQIIVPTKPISTAKDILEMRRRPKMPDLKTSLILRNSTMPIDSSKVSSWNIIQFPNFDNKSNVACYPIVFGYSKEQAAKLFTMDGYYECPGEDIIAFNDTQLKMHCPDNSDPKYFIGTKPTEEILGDSKIRPKWIKYTSPVDSGESEFAFGKCSPNNKQGAIHHKISKSASKRAKNITEQIKNELGLKTPIKPLSVLFLMFDGYSRQHFFRNSNQTIEFLNQEIVKGEYSDKFAIYDFLINNAHAENTQPNVVPFFYGYSLMNHKLRLEGFSINNPNDTWKFEELQHETA